MTNIILTGMPGAGKGTQGALLAEELGIPHISTGDIFRREMQLKTPLGLAITESMNAGKYTSDEITNEVVRKRLTEPDAQAGFILDGYPRTVQQVLFLDQQSILIDIVINLRISPDIAVARLLSRAKDQSRGDDTAEVINTRIKTYFNTLEPVLAIYRKRGLLLDINAAREIKLIANEIHTRILGF